jgi:FdrA protein
MVMIRTIIRENDYHDSVFLMNIAEQVQGVEGLKQIVIVMGTETNKTLLRDLGMLDFQASAATTNDMIIAIEVEKEEMIEEILIKINNLLSQKPKKDKETMNFPSLEMALRDSPEVNLALISVPGEFAANEAKKVVMKGINAFIFSDNVPIAEELELKNLASSKGVFVMGPGCGTSLINGIAIGIMSAVRPGPIGIVGASGSGIQTIAALIDRSGLGISQAIGTGGRDLSDEVGGITMMQGIEFFEADGNTKVLVIVSKPPGPKTLNRILERISRCRKPVVINILGGDRELLEKSGSISASTLEEAAIQAVNQVKGESTGKSVRKYVPLSRNKKTISLINSEINKFGSQQKYLRGLFCGGTLCEEAILILKDFIDNLYSNVSLPDCLPLRDVNTSHENCLIDMGAEEFTRGKPHPVLEPEILKPRLWKEGSDPEVAVVLLDFILGYGAHPDPAGVLAETITLIKERAKEENRHLSIVASVCGTENDPQNLYNQENKLRESDVIVMPSSAKAAFLSGLIILEKAKK